MSRSVSTDSRWLRRRLLTWGRQNFRPFPWRSDRDVYRTLVTEVLLKQTGAERVVPIRDSLLRRYPTPHDLGRADRLALKELIRPLGLADQRAGHLVALGRSISELDRMPVTVNDLLRLPAVGRYTAAAVACFSWGRAVPALDVNVARIIARVHGIQNGRGELRRSDLVMALAKRLLKGALSRRLNWALLDLGALICRPKPKCVACPLIERCAHANAQLDRLLTTSAS